MLKMINYDSSFSNNLQRPSFNGTNLQTNTTDYRYKPSSPIGGSMSSLNQMNKLESDKRFIHANNKYPSPRIPIQNNLKSVETFQSDSRNFVTKTVKQIKPLSFSETRASFNDNDAYTKNNDSNSKNNDLYNNKNYYQSTKEQPVKSISLSEKKSHSNHNSHPNDNHNDHVEHVKPSKPKINKGYLLKMKRKHKNKISANVSGTKFEIIKSVLESMGCKILPDDNFDSNVIWDDTKVSVENISELKSFQRYNHFVAMSEISRKDALARNMLKMYKVLPQEFDFVPKTWLMPSDYTSLASYSIEMKKMQQKRTFIMKPSNGAMGHGIKLFKNIDKIIPTDNFIIQEYISNPYLLDGYKFDLRIYALVTSCDPLRAFIFNNGLVRLGTEKYQEPSESNIDHLYMHLTNYSVNKRSKNYDEGDINGETGTKRSLKYLFDYFSRKNIDSSKVWKSIQDIILKTLLVAEPYLFHTYKMCRPGQLPGTESVCFEILGFDIMLDDKLKPWVLEVNRCPSFGANQQIDFDIKSRLLSDSFDLLHLRASDRTKSQKMEKSESKRRLYNLDSHNKKSDIGNSISIATNGFNNSSNNLNNLNNNTNMKRFKTKEKRKLELIDQIKLLRREQRRLDYENRNLGNFSRLFPIDDKYDMDYYLNILSTAFNMFYPIGKHIQWKKNYNKIREDELLEELAECDDRVYNVYDKMDQARILNEYIKDDYLSSESSEESSSDSEEESKNTYAYNADKATNDQRLINNTIYNSNKHHVSDNKVDRQKNLSENSYDFNHIYYDGSNNNSQRNSVQDYDIQSENGKTERFDSDKNSFIMDKSQPKVSTNSLLNQEHVRSNRISTLMHAVSNSSQYPVLGNKKSTNSTVKQKPEPKQSITSVDTEALDITANGDDNNDVINANSETSAELNLIKQIEQHQAKQNSKTKTKHANHKQENHHHHHIKNSISNKDVEEEISNNNSNHLTIAVLKLLYQLEIKFPGKTNEQTKSLLQKIYYKLETYKPKLGNYWMVKLDDAKRVKILNIVKSNLIVILQKVYLINSVENIRLYKIFVKLLNRMLWMHGQGLWNCFSSAHNSYTSNWEAIFSKSSFNISENELKCCHRIIELCKDCVLIVYQYAFEQKPSATEPLQNTGSLYKLKVSSASNSNISIKAKV